MYSGVREWEASVSAKTLGVSNAIPDVGCPDVDPILASRGRVGREGSRRSLLDDPFFLAELERLDDLPEPVEVWGGVHWLTDPRVSEASDDAVDARAAEDFNGQHGRDARPAQAGSLIQLRRTLLAVGGVVMMMMVGAAAAAVVFHDRVAQILQMLR